MSYSAGSLLAFLRSRPEYGNSFEVHHKTFDLNGRPERNFDWGAELDWSQFDVIAVSCYIWSHKQSQDLMLWIKSQKLRSKIIAGGYQINSKDEGELRKMYPHADHFILGYAEQALYECMAGSVREPILKREINFECLPSPYRTNEISIQSETTKIRLETKRGCPFGCTFCAQNDLNQKKTKYHLSEKLVDELEFLAGKGIQRISVTDPVFNMGKTYLPYLEAVKDLKMNGVFNFQVRPELIVDQKDIRFMELLSDTNSEIELGLQTFDPVVNNLIHRGNKYRQIEAALRQLIEYKIDFGISLIYGLPGQTLASFEKDLEKVQALGITKVVAFPLMVLPGTPMFNQKDKFGIEEGIIEGGFNIPHVVSSSTFSDKDWERMHALAALLNPDKRLF